MQITKKIFKVIFVLFLAVLLFLLHFNLLKFIPQKVSLESYTNQAFEEPISLEAFQNPESINQADSSSEDTIQSKPIEISEVSNRVGFISQAPLANWEDPRQQDACEEASILMAMNWVYGINHMSPQDAEEEILKISRFQEDNFGVYKDTSAQDTFDWIVREYFKYDKAWLQIHITVEDVIDELYRGNLVVVPTNGQALGNPNFVGEGPPTHMIVITGYDPKKEKFTTNDPGTRNGFNYIYKKSTLEKAIRDYGTGYHALNSDLPTSMIVISR